MDIRKARRYVRRTLYQKGTPADALARFVQLAGIGAAQAAHHQHGVHLRGQLARFVLPEGRSGADGVLNGEVLYPAVQHGQNFLPTLVGKGGLRHRQRAFHLRQRGSLFPVVNSINPAPPVTDGADNFGMIALPHQNDRQAAGAVAGYHVMQPGDKRAREVNDLVRRAPQGLGDFWSHAMAADEHHLASRLLHLVDDRYAHGVQPPDDLRVVRQLAEGNDGFSFLCGFDRPVHRPLDPHAEARVTRHRNRHKTVLLSIS